MAFTLPPLPYAYDGLSPVISKETLEFHHDKHHQAYTDNLNKALDGLAEAEGKSLEDIATPLAAAGARRRTGSVRAEGATRPYSP